MSEPWGAALYGDPCRECGFDWSGSDPEWLSSLGARLTEVTAGAEGSERRADGGWSVTEYVGHIGDNLRQWSERVQSARLAGRPEVAGYDPDELARARGYAALPLPVAVWSAERAVAGWLEVLRPALAESVELQHATRGLQRAEDIVRNNCHDVHHHLWDIREIVSGGGQG